MTEVENGGIEMSQDLKVEIENKKKVWHHFGGIFLALLTSLLLALEMLVVKLLLDHGIDGPNAGFWEVFIFTSMSIPILVSKKVKARKIKNSGQQSGASPSTSPFATIWPLTDPKRRNTLIGVIARAILLNLGTIARYISLDYLPLGDSAVISFSSPILVSILAHFFLHEKTGIVPISTAVLALIGVAVITKPPFLTGAEVFDHKTLIGISLAILSLACNSFQTIVVRKVRAVDYSLQVMFSGISGFICTFALTQMMGGFTPPKTVTTISLALALGIMSFSSATLFVVSLKLETAEVVSLVGTSNCIFAFLAQLVVLKEAPDLFSGIGGLVIFSGILVIALRKYLMSLPKENKMARRFRFLLY